MKHRTLRITAVLLLAASAAMAGTLRAGQPRFANGQVTIPIILEGDVGPGVSALNFRVEYDPNVLKPLTATAGPAAQAADKAIQYNKPADGQYNVVMLGMTQATVSNGEVANVVMQTIAKPPDGRSAINITQTALSSLEGTEIPSQGSSNTVDFAADTGQSSTDQPATTTSDQSNSTASTTTTNPAASASTSRSTSETPAVPGAAQPAQGSIGGVAASTGPTLPAVAPTRGPSSTAPTKEQLAGAVQRIEQQRAGIPTPGATNANTQGAVAPMAGGTVPEATGEEIVGTEPVSGVNAAGPDKVQAGLAAASDTASASTRTKDAASVAGSEGAQKPAGGVKSTPTIAIVLALAVLLALIVIVRRLLVK